MTVAERTQILKATNNKDLQEISRGYGLTISTNKKRKTKDELISQILEYEANEREKKKAEEKAEQCDRGIVGLKKIAPEKKEKFIDAAPIGAIVAAIFPVMDGETQIGLSVKSAKIVNKSKSGKKLKLETSYGRVQVVGYEDVVWVKDGRWPGGIIKLFNTTNKRRATK